MFLKEKNSTKKSLDNIKKRINMRCQEGKCKNWAVCFYQGKALCSRHRRKLRKELQERKFENKNFN